MTTPFQNALIAQRSNRDILARVLPNFRKMGKEKFTLTRTQARIDQVEDLWKTCKALHIELQQLAAGTADVTDEYFTKQEFLSIEEDYVSTFDMLAELRTNIRKAETLVKPAATSDQSTISNLSDGHPSVQLPRIQVPTFSGNLIEWENFHDLFESLVARNEALSDSQRLHYLKSSVTGEAALLISHLKITDSNYEAACKLLKDEYDNKREIIHAHIHSFADLPIMKTESAAELKTLRDAVTASIAALSNLQRSVDSWDDLLVYMISQKFSAHTRNEWNMHLGSSTEYPTYKQIRDFLTIRIRGLAAKPSCPESNQPASSSGQRHNNRNKVSVNNTTVSNKKCPVCSASHYLTYCPVFKRQSVEQRGQTAKQSKVCFNCLRPGHYPTTCPNQQRCTKCQRTHHSLLHRESWATNNTSGASNAHSSNQPGPNAPAPETSGALTGQLAAQQNINYPSSTAVTMHSSGSMQLTKVLLATAWVMLRTHEGRTLQLRALLDQGSLYSFVSESVAQSLRTTRYPANMHVTGFGEQYSGTVKSHLQLTLEPCHGHGPKLAMTAYVFKKLTAYAATKSTSVRTLPHLKDLPLADPHPDSGEPIQLLIGADLYGSLLLNDLRQGPVGTPTGQHTIFGWILSGPVGTGQPSQCPTASVFNCVSFADTDRIMQSLWEVENVPIKCPLTKEDLQCAEHFDSTHSRTDTGEYVVRLPFRDGPPIDIGESLTLTRKLYDVLERRLNNKPELAAEYSHFLHDYESLGHMEVVKHTDICRYPPVYIPHHPVLRDDSSTTRLRVVFNASSKTSNRTTLNDHLLTGPKLQADLSAIILRWRQHCYVYTADIAKMYRQIRVHRDDADYQRILWRPEKNHPILVYRLLTLTYGTAPAPYLAMRVLQQLATDEGSDFPVAVDILKNCIYVDDILFGADDLSSLREARSQLIALCARGGFRPRKWAANQRELLTDIPAGDHELAFDHPLNETDTLKVLGVTWLPDQDSFKFQTTSLPPSTHTKRTVLSFIARLFDPLGWATPVIIAAKIFMQDLWLRKIEWDDPIPDDLRVTWNEYYQNLHHLSNLRIPRWTGQYPDNLAIELHGFADASSRAYGAVVYARVLHTYDTIQISLLAAKSKVAPLKTISIPRLELCAAVLLTKLLKFVRDTLNLPHVPVCGWSDSTVALAWISQHPSKWKTFTANRVSDIQTRMPEMIWKHVDSKSNPADCASRGISAEELLQHSLWWAGPTWLSQPSAMWPSSRENNNIKASDYHTVIMSEIKNTAICHTVQPVEEWDLIHKVSSWPRLLRVTAYIMRFVQNLRIQKTGGVPLRSDLTSREIREARVFWIRSVQRLFFSNEIKALQAKLPISKSSSILALNPTLGKDGLVRLGGRLKNSFLSHNEKYPIIIPRHRIAELIVSHAHQYSLHGGTQLTLRSLRQQFWVLGARTIVKTHIRKCIRCVRERATTATQVMGDLPSPRVNPSAPFTHTGVDYAGPMQVIPVVGRGQRSRKYYVAVFVCLSTKAVHLEYVDDCATTGFLAAFRRFVSRRGLPTDVYSDNGTNFKGADRELTQVLHALRNDPSWRDYFIEQEITWHFIPAAAPHFGGLWEAGVKSFKHHLKRVVGSKTLSQTEFSTLLCQIEACLNSRPLVALKDDPSDLEALTPGHFLIGRPLIGVPEQSLCELNENRLSRWQLVQAMREHIWRAWSHDYLHTLQQRNKWQTASPEIQTNELVLLKNNLLPPSKWELARVTQVHPGSDGHVRVVTVRTAQTSIKRPIAQICRLPISS